MKHCPMDDPTFAKAVVKWIAMCDDKGEIDPEELTHDVMEMDDRQKIQSIALLVSITAVISKAADEVMPGLIDDMLLGLVDQANG